MAVVKVKTRVRARVSIFLIFSHLRTNLSRNTKVKKLRNFLLVKHGIMQLYL